MSQTKMILGNVAVGVLREKIGGDLEMLDLDQLQQNFEMDFEMSFRILDSETIRSRIGESQMKVEEDLEVLTPVKKVGIATPDYGRLKRPFGSFGRYRDGQSRQKKKEGKGSWHLSSLMNGVWRKRDSRFNQKKCGPGTSLGGKVGSSHSGSRKHYPKMITEFDSSPGAKKQNKRRKRRKISKKKAPQKETIIRLTADPENCSNFSDEIEAELKTVYMSNHQIVNKLIKTRNGSKNQQKLRLVKTKQNGINLTKITPGSKDFKIAKKRCSYQEGCNCKKSNCNKLYCPCFARGRYCLPTCNCCNCMNKPPTTGLPKNSKKRKERKICCSCKNSHCIKNYCECFRAGVPCGEHCTCINCKNTPELYPKNGLLKKRPLKEFQVRITQLEDDNVEGDELESHSIISEGTPVFEEEEEEDIPVKSSGGAGCGIKKIKMNMLNYFDTIRLKGIHR